MGLGWMERMVSHAVVWWGAGQERGGAGRKNSFIDSIIVSLITLALCALALKMDIVLPFSLSNGIQTILVMFAAPYN